jgi:hypothetical protein
MKDPTLEAALSYVRPPWYVRLWKAYLAFVGYSPRPSPFSELKVQSTAYPNGRRQP